MKNKVFRIDSDGFNGAWYPAPGQTGRGLIIMLGDSSEDYMARTAAKWLNRQGIHAEDDAAGRLRTAGFLYVQGGKRA